MRTFGAILLACLALMTWVGFSVSAEEDKAEQAVPVIEVDTPVYDFKEVAQGKVVKHDFRVLNRGTAPLEIEKVKPG